MPTYLPAGVRSTTRVMVFIDGENLAIRYGAMLNGAAPLPHFVYEKDVYVWSRKCNIGERVADVVRRFYFTSADQDDQRRQRVFQALKEVGIEQPRVFPRHKSKGSKQVDISLATEMLTNAHRNNYDHVVLVAGDEDFLPVVEAVQYEGKRVTLWFVENGLSQKLQTRADYFYDLGANVLFQRDNNALSYIDF